MVTPSSNLAEIRTTLLQELADASVALGSPIITYQLQPQARPWDPAKAVVLATVATTGRQALGTDAEPMIEQRGNLTMQWRFPRSTGMATVAGIVEQVAALYRAQTLAGGVILDGDARTERVGRSEDDGRTRWDIVVRWRRILQERAAGDGDPLLGLDLPTTAEALATVRNVWLTRIEQAVVADAWGGLLTLWDDEPTLPAVPTLPFCGYWLGALTPSSAEAQSSTETVVGQSYAQLHTDPSLGTATASAVVERIIAEHNRTERGVIFRPVQVGRQVVTKAGTAQTTLRLPFQFDRLRS